MLLTGHSFQASLGDRGVVEFGIWTRGNNQVATKFFKETIFRLRQRMQALYENVIYGMNAGRQADAN